METGIPGLNLEELKLKGFKIYQLAPSEDLPTRTGRRDYYKLGLINGEISIEQDGQLKDIKGAFLILINPRVPKSIVRRVNRTSGYACVFTETFMSNRILRDSPLFNIAENPVIPIDSTQAAFISNIFEKMLVAYDADYTHKADLIKNCIWLIIHEALSIQPPQHGSVEKNGANRITHLFMDMLEKQFPIEHTTDVLQLRTAQDFASALAVHVNYLNRAVKAITGKPTSVYIAMRIAAEAEALLQHTDWSVSEIAYALGFSYPAYFNNFFKRVTGNTPNAIRKV
jgi:AraC family transcriptional activator of pobA